MLTVTEAARATRVHQRTLWRAIRAGKLAAVRTPGGQFRIDPAALAAAFPPA